MRKIGRVDSAIDYSISQLPSAGYQKTGPTLDGNDQSAPTNHLRQSVNLQSANLQSANL
jgi:hypothetical protein